MRKIFFSVLMLMLLMTIISNVHAQTPQETLAQYISDLQKNPNDNALREKIIRHVQTMSPAPAVPEEARRHYVKASTLFDDAKQPSDSADAAEEFRKALLIAPWWGEAYMKMGLALEAANRYDGAIAALRLFIATKPNEGVLRKAQDEIYKIEAKAQKAEKDKGQAARKAVEDERAKQEVAEAKRAREQEEFLRKIDGAKYIYSFWDSDSRSTINWFVDIKGRKLVLTSGNGFEWCRVDIQGREAVWQMNNYERVVFTVGEETITKTGSNAIMVFRRVR